MVPSFGCFVNKPVAIAPKDREGGGGGGDVKRAHGFGIVLIRSSLKVFYSESVCGSNRLAALGAFSNLLKVGISEKLV